MHTDEASAALDMLRSRVTVNESGCWIWTGTKLPKGYGRVRFNGKDVYTHRLALEARGVDLGRLNALHMCNTPSCCNPDHLYAGTQKENVRDAKIAGTHRDPPRAPRTGMSDRARERRRAYMKDYVLRNREKLAEAARRRYAERGDEVRALKNASYAARQSAKRSERAA